MELILVRHALPEWAEDDPAKDPPLSMRGCDQARALAQRWRSVEFHAVYSSPARRAYQTAAIAIGDRPLEITVLPGIAEFDWGEGGYVPFEQAHVHRPELADRMRAVFTADTSEMVRWRAQVVEAIDSVVAEHPSSRVAVVCHAGVILTYLAHVSRADPTAFRIDYTGSTIILAGRDGRRTVRVVNDTCHLSSGRGLGSDGP